MKTSCCKDSSCNTKQYATDGWVDDTPAGNALSNKAKGLVLRAFLDIFGLAVAELSGASSLLTAMIRMKTLLNSKKLCLR